MNPIPEHTPEEAARFAALTENPPGFRHEPSDYLDPRDIPVAALVDRIALLRADHKALHPDVLGTEREVEIIQEIRTLERRLETARLHHAQRN